MSTTWLTKRRAVDNCRVSSALCRMRWAGSDPGGSVPPRL